MPQNSEKTSVSVVTPVYRCAGCLAELAQRTRQSLEPICDWFEIIMVNDGSPDDAWSTIVELAGNDPQVRGINLSRNFGQHYAIAAGIDYASAAWVVVMDGDLQDCPEMIPRMIDKAKEGDFDVVFGVADFRSRKGVADRFLSKVYYYVYDVLSGHGLQTENASFAVMRHRVTESYARLRENRRQHISLLQYLGYRIGYCPVVHDERPYGTSSYSLLKRLRHAFYGITSSTTRLLRFGVYMGMLFSFGSIAMATYVVFSKLLVREYDAGWPSLISAIFFVGGVILFTLGIIGVYIETIFYEVKNRPLYFVRDSINIPRTTRKPE